MNPVVKVGKIGLDILHLTELHSVIFEAVHQNKKKTILNINARLVELAHTTDSWLVPYVNSVSHVFCDGAGIQLAARLTRQQIPEKITYNIWLWQLAAFCKQHNFKLFLLGGDTRVVSRAIENLKISAPGLNVQGHHGFFNKDVSNKENSKVVEEINLFKPNILLVCFGMPLQERWVKENADQLNANIFLTGGGALDYISGTVKSTPKIFSKLYLEWFYRLCQNPKRLWRRYSIGNLIFGWVVFKDLFHYRQ